MTPDDALAILGLDVPAMVIDSSRAGSGLLIRGRGMNGETL